MPHPVKPDIRSKAHSESPLKDSPNENAHAKQIVILFLASATLLSLVIVVFFSFKKEGAKALSPLSLPLTHNVPKLLAPQRPNEKDLIYQSQLQQPVSALKLVPENTATELPASIDKKVMSTILLMQAKYATGDFDGAYALAQNILQEPGQNSEVIRYIEKQLPAIMISAGFSHIRFNRFEKAIELLENSKSYGPLPEASKGLALAYFKLRRIPEALREAELYLQKDPLDEAILVIVSDLYESQGNFEEALKWLTQAESSLEKKVSKSTEINLRKNQEAIQKEEIDLEEATKNLEIIRKQKRNMTSRAKIAKTQRTELSSYFKLSFSEAEHELLQGGVLNILHEAIEELTNIYGFKVPKDPIEVILYKKEDFKLIHEESPAWADGLYNGRIRVPISTEASENELELRLKRVLRHELVHALFAEMTGQRKLPPWLDEGMAQRFSCQSSQCRPFLFAANRGQFLKLSEFESTFLNSDSHKAQRLYQQSLYLILTLENAMGTESLSTILLNLRSDGDLTSDGILKPLQINFGELHHKATLNWNQKINYWP